MKRIYVVLFAVVLCCIRCYGSLGLDEHPDFHSDLRKYARHSGFILSYALKCSSTTMNNKLCQIRDKDPLKAFKSVSEMERFVNAIADVHVLLTYRTMVNIGSSPEGLCDQNSAGDDEFLLYIKSKRDTYCDDLELGIKRGATTYHDIYTDARKKTMGSCDGIDTYDEDEACIENLRKAQKVLINFWNKYRDLLEMRLPADLPEVKEVTQG